MTGDWLKNLKMKIAENTSVNRVCVQRVYSNVDSIHVPFQFRDLQRRSALQ